MRVESFYQKDILALIPALAELRIKVFHDFPYLYEGDLAYEKNYLKIYAKSLEAVVVGAFDGDKLVGAATALPLFDEVDYVKKPFLEAGINIDDVYYFAESVLLQEYRGRGLGHLFFDGREVAAKKYGYSTTCFCAVERAVDHPSRPTDYSPLDDFWKKRGYEKRSELKSEFSWRDIGDTSETKKTMIYWMKKC